jgi:hypothetical protein
VCPARPCSHTLRTCPWTPLYAHALTRSVPACVADPRPLLLRAASQERRSAPQVRTSRVRSGSADIPITKIEFPFDLFIVTAGREHHPHTPVRRRRRARHRDRDAGHTRTPHRGARRAPRTRRHVRPPLKTNVKKSVQFKFEALVTRIHRHYTTCNIKIYISRSSSACDRMRAAARAAQQASSVTLMSAPPARALVSMHFQRRA